MDVKNSTTAVGRKFSKVDINSNIEIENFEHKIPTKVIIGTSDNIRKNAKLPGNILISGFVAM